MKPTSEIQALQNFADKFSLTVKEFSPNDKRKTVNRYFLTDKHGNGVSPILDYECLNVFLLGWNNSIKLRAKTKSREAKAVLRLMDDDFSYEQALNIVLRVYFDTERSELETELNQYI